MCFLCDSSRFQLDNKAFFPNLIRTRNGVFTWFLRVKVISLKGREKALKKQNLLKWINGLLIIAFLCAAAGVLLYRYGPLAWQGHEILYQIHTISGLLFIFLGLIHLSLNWSWIRTVYLKKRKRGGES
jgi:hypothetical protein